MRFTTALLAAAAVVAVSAQGNATNVTASPTLPGTVTSLPAPTNATTTNGTLSTSPVPSAGESSTSSQASSTNPTNAPAASPSSAAGIVYTANSLGAFVLAIGAMAAGQLV